MPTLATPATDASAGPLPALGPTTGGERLSLLDALRGFALAGVFLVNLGALSLYYYLNAEQRAALPTAGFDHWGRMALAFFASEKFITLFSLLFGLGFAVQLMRAEERGGDAIPVYVRRLLVLLLIGSAHWVLLWWGDVLRFYAVLGFVLLLFRRASQRVLLWTGLTLTCVGAALLGLVFDPLLEPTLRTLPSHAAANARALAAFSGESYAAVVRTNPWYDGLLVARNWYEPLFIFGRFLLGFWAGRMLLLHDPAAHRALLGRIFAGGLALGLLGNAVRVLRDFFELTERVPVLDGALGGAVLNVLTSTGSIALGVAYATGFALLFLRPAWRRRLEVLAPVGRMALTNYLAQTLIGVALFYGIGLGVGPRFGIPGRLVVFALVFAAQIAFSRWWLARFRFGPAEWVWRSLTYLRPQPMRLAPRASAPAILHLMAVLLLTACSAPGRQSVGAAPSPWPGAEASAYRYRPPPRLDDGWRTAAVGEVGLSPGLLERMTDAIRRGEEYRNIHAVLIARDGRLVYEEYFAGEDERRGVGKLGHVVFDRDTRHDLRSVTKSVVSALVGIAVGEGAIRSPDQPLLDFFPEHADLATPGWRAVTLRHALDMSAGLDWNEAGSTLGERQMNQSADPVRFVLERPVVAAPGSRWSYNGGLTQLLAEVVRRATGRPLLAYAREKLFEPLGITDVEWFTYPGRETPSAASGLRLRPRDVAKLGLLYQQQGRWNGRQVVPAHWVAESLRRRIAVTDSIVELGDGATGEIGYGHQWWHGRYALPYGSFTAHRAVGNGGQLVFLVPELRLTAVVHAGTYDQFHDATRLVLERVVPWALGRGDAYRFWAERPVRRVSPGEWPEVALTSAERARYTGVYDHDGARVRIWDEAGVLRMTPFPGTEGGPIHLVPMGGHVFAFGVYQGGRLTRVYWPDGRIEFEVSGGRAVRYRDRTVDGHVYTTAGRVP